MLSPTQERIARMLASAGIPGSGRLAELIVKEAEGGGGYGGGQCGPDKEPIRPTTRSPRNEDA